SQHPPAFPTRPLFRSETSAMRRGILKTMNFVRESCLPAPFTRERIARSDGSSSSAVTIHGPIGRCVSKFFPLNHCPPCRRCTSRSEEHTSELQSPDHI